MTDDLPDLDGFRAQVRQLQIIADQLRPLPALPMPKRIPDHITGLDLFACTIEEMQLDQYAMLIDEQRMAAKAILAGNCQSECAAAVTHFSECDCTCKGFHHGAVWTMWVEGLPESVCMAGTSEYPAPPRPDTLT